MRLSAPDDQATYLLPQVLAGITKAHPRLQFEVTCDNASDLLPLLEHGDLDVVVATHPLSAVTGQITRQEPLHWVESPQYVDDPKIPLSFVLFPFGCVCRDIALDALKQIDRPWHTAYSTRSIGLMEQAMLEGAGVNVYPLMPYEVVGRLEKSFAEHQEISEAIFAKDGPSGNSLMRDLMMLQGARLPSLLKALV